MAAYNRKTQPTMNYQVSPIGNSMDHFGGDPENNLVEACDDVPLPEEKYKGTWRFYPPPNLRPSGILLRSAVFEFFGTFGYLIFVYLAAVQFPVYVPLVRGALYGALIYTHFNYGRLQADTALTFVLWATGLQNTYQSLAHIAAQNLAALAAAGVVWGVLGNGALTFPVGSPLTLGKMWGIEILAVFFVLLVRVMTSWSTDRLYKEGAWRLGEVNGKQKKVGTTMGAGATKSTTVWPGEKLEYIHDLVSPFLPTEYQYKITKGPGSLALGAGFAGGLIVGAISFVLLPLTGGSLSFLMLYPHFFQPNPVDFTNQFLFSFFSPLAGAIPVILLMLVNLIWTRSATFYPSTFTGDDKDSKSGTAAGLAVHCKGHSYYTLY